MQDGGLGTWARARGWAWGPELHRRQAGSTPEKEDAAEAESQAGSHSAEGQSSDRIKGP